MAVRPCCAVFLLTLGLTGCTASAPVLPSSPASQREVTLFVPGYKGSFLVDDQHHRAWLTPGAVLGRGEKSLALPFPGQAPLPVFGPLRPDGPLTRFTVFPFVREDIYLSWMEYARDRLPGFIPFSYDWRQDIRQSARELCQLIDRLAAERGATLQVNLVAHSMGGLVALSCLRHGSGEPGSPAPDWSGAVHVRRVVFVGTPFAGTPGIFDDFFVGTETVRNRALMSPEAHFSFPASFQLLPFDPDFFVDASGQHVALDPYLPATWWTQGWGVFAAPERRANVAYRAQLEQQLKARQALVAELTAPGVQPPGLEAMAVIGHGRPVTSAVRFEAGHFDFDHSPTADGDGTVLATSALPPPWLKAERLDSTAEHTALMRDPAVTEAISRFLLPAGR